MYLKVNVKDYRNAASIGISVLVQKKKNLLFITDGYTLKSDALIWVILIGTICEQKALAFTSNSLFVEASCQKLNKHVFKCLQTVIKSRRISLSSSHIFVRDTSFLTIVKLGMSTSCFFCNNLFNLFNSFVYLINGFSSDYWGQDGIILTKRLYKHRYWYLLIKNVPGRWRYLTIIEISKSWKILPCTTNLCVTAFQQQH